MERKIQNVNLKKGNLIELPLEALEILKVKIGDEIKLLFAEDAIILMSSEKFGEKLLEKI
ncbi:MAG: hypothetical protein K2J85_07635 [Anaeroplasmataceae bacterium]|nr:hypothetical protein [Anaeroplasmataceae bacterium]